MDKETENLIELGIIGCNDELIENFLTESKEDIQRFKDKFGDDVYDLFVKSKDRLKNANVSTDIVWHTKNTEVDDLRNILYNLRSKVKPASGDAKSDLTDIPGKYNYLGKAGEYDVYQPLDVEASMALGVGTGWCTTGRYGHAGDINAKPSVKDATKHFEDYTSRGIKLYYYLKDGIGQYAIALMPRSLAVDTFIDDEHYCVYTNYEVYDQYDVLDFDVMLTLDTSLIQGLDANIKKCVDGLFIENGVLIKARKTITKANIPEGVVKINGRAFYTNLNLKEVTIPNTVQFIGYEAFYRCLGLTTITIPASVKFMGEGVFDMCDNLKTIYCEAPSKPAGWDTLWNNSLSGKEIWNNGKQDEALNEALLLEKTRQELISKSKSGRPYSPKNQAKGKNRWERRLKSRIANSIRDYNRIDMNAFFKGDILEFVIKVQGETNNYDVTVTFEDILRNIQQNVKANDNKLEFSCVLQALLRSFNSGNIYVNCNCLHPDTKIKLLDGTTPTVKEMKERFDNGEKLYVYSTDENGDFKPGEVEKVWIAKTTKDFIKVTLDSGEEIITTPDHPYMLRDGSYELAENLVEGQSLMPMYFNTANGYELVKLNTQVRGWKSVYKLVAEYLKQDEIQEAIARALPEDNMNYDVAIHHKDFNKKNNTPENLQIMTAREHWDYHASLSYQNKPKEMQEHIKEGARKFITNLNKEPTEKMIEFRKKWQEKGKLRNYDEDRKQLQSNIMKQVIKEHPELYTTDVCRERTLKTFREHPEYGEKISRSQKKVWSNYTEEEYKRRCLINKHNNEKAREKISKSHKVRFEKMSIEERKHFANITRANSKRGKFTLIKNILQQLIDDKMPLTIENYELYRKNLNIKGYPKLNNFFTSIDEAISYFKLNHKVAKVERITLEETPVYDIKVKDWENFVVDAGVVLHNCPDFRYRFAHHSTEDKYNSGMPELRPNRFDWTNAHNDMGSACKHVNLVISNLDWMMKIASVINNYIRYCKDNMARNYADYIFPQVYGMPYNRAIQLSLFDDPDDNGLLPSDQDTISKALERTMQNRDDKGRFASGNEYRFQKQEPKQVNKPSQEDENPLNLKFDRDEIEDEQ